jgi:hypothetical protein
MTITYQAAIVENALREGVNDLDGYLTPTQPYRVLRYIGIEAEDQIVIKHADWYGIAWVSLMQLLPNIKRDELIMTPDFPMQEDSIKYNIVKETCHEVLYDAGYQNAEVSEFDGDIILILHQEIEAEK